MAPPRPAAEPCAALLRQLGLEAGTGSARGRQGGWHPGELVLSFIVTNLSRPADRGHNQRGKQHIKEGKNAIRWTRLSCRKFRNNEVRLQLHALAWFHANTGKEVEHWSIARSW